MQVSLGCTPNILPVSIGEMVTVVLTILMAFASVRILSSIVDTVIGECGYPAVFAAAFLEVIFPPIPSEVISLRL